MQKRNASGTRINIAVALVLITIILIFRALNNDSVINTVYTIAGYTYGPLLGLVRLWPVHQTQDQGQMGSRWWSLLSPVLAWLLNLLLINCIWISTWATLFCCLTA